MSSSNYVVELGNNKPPLLKAGEFNSWKVLFTNWIKRNDFQAWTVIEDGDYEVDATLAKDMKNWGKDEYMGM